jgi:hypothetical protein
MRCQRFLPLPALAQRARLLALSRACGSGTRRAWREREAGSVGRPKALSREVLAVSARSCAEDDTHRSIVLPRGLPPRPLPRALP